MICCVGMPVECLFQVQSGQIVDAEVAEDMTASNADDEGNVTCLKWNTDSGSCLACLNAIPNR